MAERNTGVMPRYGLLSSEMLDPADPGVGPDYGLLGAPVLNPGDPQAQTLREMCSPPIA